MRKYLPNTKKDKKDFRYINKKSRKQDDSVNLGILIMNMNM